MLPPCAQRNAQRDARKVELSDALNKKPAELSGGMCRRVALARALAFDADILLLDEPFKGLDTELRGRIVKLVEDFAKTKPVILITHDPWEVSLAKAKLDIESKNPAVSNSRYFYSFTLSAFSTCSSTSLSASSRLPLMRQPAALTCPPPPSALHIAEASIGA